MRHKNLVLLLGIFFVLIACFIFISASDNDWINGFNNQTGEAEDGAIIPDNYYGEIKCLDYPCSFKISGEKFKWDTLDGRWIGIADKKQEADMPGMEIALIKNENTTREERFIYLNYTIYFALSSEGYSLWRNITVPCPNCTFFPGDYNGDGISDIFGLSNSEKKIYFSLSPDWVWNNAPLSLCSEGENCNLLPVSGDFDADKKSDFIAYNPSSGDITYLLSSQNYLSLGTVQTLCKDCQFVPGDYNRDGISDFMGYNQESKIISFALSPNFEWQSVETTCINCTFFPGDYNGDGISDIFGLSNSEKKIYFSLSPDWVWNNAPLSLCSEGENCNLLPVSGDFDADKKSDFIAYNPSSGDITYLLSSQNYLSLGTVQTLCKDCEVIPGDYDGDGLSDLILYGLQSVPIPSVAKNEKNISQYSSRKTFLVSDTNWKDVLQMVSATIWTGNETWCQRGYNTAQNVCAYPTLIFHKEDHGFDIDSAIYFMQQYLPDKLTIVGETPQELDNLLVAQPELGAGINEVNINRIDPSSYLSYWEYFDTVVYVQEDYELALVASTYASLINAPLIIKGTKWDTAGVFEDRDVICVGNVNPSGTTCIEKYNLSELQKKYIDLTHTDKIILTNPMDLSIAVTSSFSPEKSSNPIYKIYGKTSLIAPFLAGSKHEIIFTTRRSDSENISSDLKSDIQTFMPYIINNSKGILKVKDAEGLSAQNGKFFIYGYLTIIASGDSIPFREYTYNNEPDYIYRSLDQTEYSDLSNDDGYPDLSTGRIQGITLSDVSGYLARDIFYNQLVRTNKVEFLASSFEEMIDHANLWANKFRLIGYNAHCSIIPTQYSGTDFDCDITGSSYDWIEPYKNNEFVMYMDHGDSNWAGIPSRNIPLLSNSMIFNNACSTCSTYNSFSFCNWAIRKGALAHFGAVSVAFAGNFIYKKSLEGIYKENLTIGNSFTKSYRNDMENYMTTLTGDPTLNINPQYNLDGDLPWY